MGNNKNNILLATYKKLENLLKKETPKAVEVKPKEKLPEINDYKLINSTRTELANRLNLPKAISENYLFKTYGQNFKNFSNIAEISEEMDLPCGTVKPVLIKGDISKLGSNLYYDFVLFRLEDEKLNLKNLTLMFKYKDEIGNTSKKTFYDPKMRFDLYRVPVKTEDGISHSMELVRITETDRNDEVERTIRYYDKNGNWLLSDFVNEEPASQRSNENAGVKQEKKYSHAFIINESAYAYNFNYPTYYKNGIFDENILKHFPCKPLTWKFVLGKFDSNDKIINPLTFLNSLSEKEIRGLENIYENKPETHYYYGRNKVLEKLTLDQTLKDYLHKEHNFSLE